MGFRHFCIFGVFPLPYKDLRLISQFPLLNNKIVLYYDEQVSISTWRLRINTYKYFCKDPGRDIHERLENVILY